MFVVNKSKSNPRLQVSVYFCDINIKYHFITFVSVTNFFSDLCEETYSWFFVAAHLNKQTNKQIHIYIHTLLM